MRKGLYGLLMTLLLFSCSGRKADDGLKVIDVERYSKSSGGILSIEDRYKEWFRSYDAAFLENTESASFSSIKNLIGIDSTIVMLIGDKISFFDRASGKELQYFKPEKNSGFISFDIDKKNRMLYVLDAMENQICCYDFSGKLHFQIPLDSGHKYDKLLFLDEDTILVTVTSLPNRVTFLADLKSKSVKGLDLPSHDSFTPDEKELKSLSSMGPLYFTGRCDTSGVYVKYLFDEMVYKYTAQGSKAIFRVHSDKKLKYKKNIFEKSQNNLIFNGLWELTDDRFLVKYRASVKRYDRLMYFFTITNDDMDIFNKSLSYNSACMEWHTPYQDVFKSMETGKDHVFDIRPEDLFYIQNDDKMIYRVSKYRTDHTILPIKFQSHPDKDELILSYFQLN